MKTFPTLAALVLLCAVPRSALAENKDVARQAYDEGRHRYDLNEFVPALEAFKRAYLNYEDAAFLFNIAQCQRQLGKKEEAIRFYRSYLRNKPDALNREDVRAIVSKLDAEVSEENARLAAAQRNAQRAAMATPVSSAPTTNLLIAAPPTKRQPAYKKWWLWTIVGVAAAGAATGIALAVTSQRTEASLMPVTVTR